LEAQRRSLDYYIGKYLSLRRNVWSEYAAFHEGKGLDREKVEADTPAPRLINGVRKAEGNQFGKLAHFFR
jgi:hypothetical protein